MRVLIWAVTALVALCATAMVALLASASDWLVGHADEAARGLQTVTEWPVPAWVALWVDPALVEPLRAMVTWVVDVVVLGLPWLQPLLGWIAPLLWVFWGLGMLTLLSLAALAHWAVGRWRRPAQGLPAH